MTEFDYDFFVIGGGSGGVRAARRVGGLGKKVGLAEEFRMGGTCVIRGCVPKKLFVYASHYPEYFEDAKGYGFELGDTSFDWQTLMSNKDREIHRLEGLYRKGLESSGVEIFDSRATLVGPHEVKLHATGETVTAAQILVATGGFANSDPQLPGAQFCINSNGALHLDELPKSIVIAGGGYIAVEFANIFHGLGVDTTLIYRGEKILRGFDDDLRDHLQETMIAKGIKLVLGDTFPRIDKLDHGRLQAAHGQRPGDHPGPASQFAGAAGGRLYSAHAHGVAKPDPELFLIAAREAGVAPERIAVVDDSPSGCIAARRAGMRCFGYAAATRSAYAPSNPLRSGSSSASSSGLSQVPFVHSFTGFSPERICMYSVSQASMCAANGESNPM